VELRNPFGGPAGNLLVDGDFELSATSGGNLPGWLGFRYDGNRETIRFETGGLCRRGLRCAVLPPNVSFIGWGTAARGRGMTATIWAKPPAGEPCEILHVAITECWYAVGTQLVSAAAEADDSGWCRYEGGFSYAQETAACLYAEAELAYGETVLLDAAELLPITGNAPMSAAAQPLDAELASRVQRALDRARAARPFGTPLPVAPTFNRD
jgi:hypothetical protein